ncbi:MAG: NADH:flavin oxidoreductase [Planctomycetota bacterium]
MAKPVPLLDARWPSAEEAARSRLFSPVRLGPTSLTSRTWVPAMVPWRATDEGFVTDDVLDWYGRFADGRPGAIVVEATGIRDVPSGPLLRVSADRFVPGLRSLVERVRERSGGATRLFLQTIDFLAIRRRPERAKFLGRFLALTDEHRAGLEREKIRPAADDDALRAQLLALDDEQLERVLSEREWEDLSKGYRERVTDVHLPHVAALPSVLPELFASAARRARDAGFDGIELHYAHAYTMASFLSRTNTRKDGYGGSLEGRARLPLEVIEAVRAAVGDDFAVGARFLCDEAIEGGSDVTDAAHFAVRFAGAGLDFLSLSRGGKFDDAKQPKVGKAVYPYTGPSGHECMPTVRIDAAGPFGRYLPLVGEVRRAIRAAGHATPVVGCGGIATFDQAERALANETCDVVAAARQSLADPDWWEKMRRGRGSDVRRCIYTNYCEGLDQKHVEVTCQLWDRDLAGSNVKLTKDGKRRTCPPPWRP